MNANIWRDPRAWAWGLLAPAPTLIGAAVTGGFVGAQFDAAELGVAVFCAIVGMVANTARLSARRYAVAFGAGCLVTLVVAVAVVIEALSHARFG